MTAITPEQIEKLKEYLKSIDGIWDSFIDEFCLIAEAKRERVEKEDFFKLMGEIVEALRVNEIGKIKSTTRLVCPDSSISDWMIADIDVVFWIDGNDVWHVDCQVCGGGHCLGDMEIS